MVSTGAHGWLKEYVLPYVAPALAVVGSIGWLHSEITMLETRDQDREKIAAARIDGRNRSDDVQNMRITALERALVECKR